MRGWIWVALGGGTVLILSLTVTIWIWSANSDTEEIRPSGSQIGQSTSTNGSAISKEHQPVYTKPQVLNNAVSVQPATSSSPDYWMIIALVAMAFAISVSTMISFYLYHWRKILLSQPHLAVPEQVGDWLRNLAQHVNLLTNTISSSSESVEHLSQKTRDEVSTLSETFMTMQQALDERDREIQRLKRGYDGEIFRKFVVRFIRVDQAAQDMQQMGLFNKDGMYQIRRLLGDAFSECGVESFEPDIGSDYRHAFGVAEHPKTTTAENSDDDFNIVEILESGYMIRSTETSEVVVPAKVRIYRSQNGET